MSLINKMLQDLDARGGAADGALRQQQLLAVPEVERDRRPILLASAAAVVVVLGAGAWFGWQHWHRADAAVAAQLPAQASNVTPVIKRLAPAVPAVAIAPSAVAIAVPAPVVAAPPAVSAATNKSTVTTDDRPPRVTARTVAARSKPRTEAGDDAARSESSATSAAGTITHDIGPTQMAENTYRRALVALQEGRLSVAMADLERALDIDPRNDAARQTYVSLLLENKRSDDAIRQLRLALGVDPRQPGLAMVLARLQLERGGPALDTLLKTLPYAGNSAEYQAFLAGVLQREQRHEEAADHYREALKLSPQNGVWWMGLGISLQADQHLPEAREAYTRARASKVLTPELQAFVDRKLEQLAH